MDDATEVRRINLDDIEDLTEDALDEGLKAEDILNKGLMAGMDYVGVEFKAGNMFVPEVLRSEPHPPGACAMLDADGACRVYAARPYVCRTQGLPLRWAERRGMETEILEILPGEEAGIKSVTIAVNGEFAYGYLRPEKGVHRLVRLSPFDAAHRRHTSFALVEVLPQVEDDSELQISPDDLRIDVYRSSSAGGQNVQKNATAIRITHLPTGLVVTCQNERSQTQNRENAMSVLRARLFELRLQEQSDQMAELRGEYTKAEWGSQIRSYVLHPYQMVKDHRTDYETGNTAAVLDGDIHKKGPATQGRRHHLQ